MTKLMMNGREVFKFAVRQMGRNCSECYRKSWIEQKKMWIILIPHQANIRIMEASRERLELPIEKMSKQFINTVILLPHLFQFLY